MDFRDSNIYKWISKFLTWFGKIMVRFNQPKVKAKQIRKLLKLAKEGDIILRRFDCYLDSHFIGGRYTHGGVCVGGDSVIHMMSEGKLTDDLIDFVKDADGFCLMRPRYAFWQDAKAAADWARYAKAHYDFVFKTSVSDNFYYCFEFCALAIHSTGINYPFSSIIFASDLLARGDVIYEA